MSAPRGLVGGCSTQPRRNRSMRASPNVRMDKTLRVYI